MVVTIWLMKDEQSAIALAGLVALSFEPVPVRARRQLSAVQTARGTIIALAAVFVARPARATRMTAFIAKDALTRTGTRISKPGLGGCAF